MTLSPIPAPPDYPWPVGSANPPAPRDEASLRTVICHVARLMHQFRLAEGTAGSVSARLSADRFLMTPAQIAKSLLQPDQLLVIDGEGLPLESTNARPDNEAALHLVCYRQRPDVAGVVHAHPPQAVALTLAGVSLRTCILPETIITLGLVPTTPYQIPGTPDADRAIQLLIAQHDALLIAAHGSLTVGVDVWLAYLRLETLEHTALILHNARQLGPLTTLDPEQVAALLVRRKALGFWREGDEARFCEACGAC